MASIFTDDGWARRSSRGVELTLRSLREAGAAMTAKIPQWTVAEHNARVKVFESREGALVEALTVARTGRPVRLVEPTGRTVILFEVPPGTTYVVGEVFVEVPRA